MASTSRRGPSSIKDDTDEPLGGLRSFRSRDRTTSYVLYKSQLDNNYPHLRATLFPSSTPSSSSFFSSSSLDANDNLQNKIKSVAKVYVKSFLVGTAVRSLIGFVSQLLSKKRHHHHQAQLKNPLSVLHLLRTSIDVQLGLFLGSLAGGLKGLSLLFRKLLMLWVLRQLRKEAIEIRDKNNDGNTNNNSSNLNTPKSYNEEEEAKEMYDKPSIEVSQEIEKGKEVEGNESEANLKKKLASLQNLDKKIQSMGVGIDALAGVFAGLSVTLLPKSERRGWALYLLVRSAGCVFKVLSLNQYVPQSWWWKHIIEKHADVILMSLSSSQILHNFIFNRHFINPSYVKFLIVQAGKDVRMLNTLSQVGKSQPLDLPPLQAYCEEHKLDWDDVTKTIEQLRACPLLHPHQGCWEHFWSSLMYGFKLSLSLYTPIHTFTALMLVFFKFKAIYMKYKKSRSRNANNLNISNKEMEMSNEMSNVDDQQLTTGEQNQSERTGETNNNNNNNNNNDTNKPTTNTNEKQTNFHENDTLQGHEKYMKGFALAQLGAEVVEMLGSTGVKVCVNIFRSCTFLAMYVSIGWLVACFMSNYVKGIEKAAYLRPGLLLSGLATFIEHKSRRMELALYCAPQALYALLNELTEHGWLPAATAHSTATDLLLFCLASSAMFSCYVHEPRSLRPTFYSLLNWLWD
jgi:hypothetical protein